jgi:large subunit ribosomal protein L25
MTTTIAPLKATPRHETGKGAARRLRNAGHVPAIAYGKGRPATTIAVEPADILRVLHSELGRNSVVEIEIGAEGKTQAVKLLAMIREYTYHPIRRSLEHVDFVEVKLDQPVDVDIPLFWTGKPAGVTAGGVLRQVYRTVPVRCVPDRIPVKLEIDVTHLELGEHVSTQDLKLGEGVTVRLPAEQTLIAIVAPEKEVVEEVVAAPVAGAAAAPGATGAAAPAAGAAAAAAGGKAEPAKDAAKKK